MKFIALSLTTMIPVQHMEEVRVKKNGFPTSRSTKPANRKCL